MDFRWFSMFFATGALAQQVPPQAVMPEGHFEFLDKYCLSCHDSDSEKGGVNLETLSFAIEDIQTAELWQKVLNVTNSGEMPPQEKKQPPGDAKADFLADLSEQMVAARQALSDSGGTITMRRLNRREYVNTIRELLGVEVNAEELPEDGNPGDFDTNGSSLFFSSDQFEQYQKIGHGAVLAALSGGGERPEKKTIRTEPEEQALKNVGRQHANHQNNFNRAQQWRASDKLPTDFGFIDEARVKFEEDQYKRQWPSLDYYLREPRNQTGVSLQTFFTSPLMVPVTVPKNASPGEYILRIRLGAEQTADSNRRFLEIGRSRDGSGGGEMEVLDCYGVPWPLDEPGTLEIPIRLNPADLGQNLLLRQRMPNNRRSAQSRFLRDIKDDGIGPEPVIWIDWVELEGPMIETWPTPEYLQILPDNEGEFEKRWNYLRNVVETFATRAFRGRMPEKSYVDRLMATFSESRNVHNRNLHEALADTFSVVLTSPGFLYLSEPLPDTQRRELTGRELAIRLSYFLWSAPPDNELIQLGESDQLLDAGVLKQQTLRLLEDPRSQEFISGFSHQWLHMERLDFFQFNHSLYPEFDSSVKNAAREEVYQTIRTLMDENLPIRNLIRPDFVVINETLADYYDIPDVRGAEFRKVAVPDNSTRGGLLGMAAVHAMGSDGERTSPVERGAWMLRSVLNSPPPPAPANVPQLSEASSRPVSTRKLLAAHQAEPQCAQCHRKIDPLGFGLENFDAAGKWRATETVHVSTGKRSRKSETFTIDPSGVMPDGNSFSTFHELRAAVADSEPALARGFTEALIAYGLGRPYGFSDELLAEQMMKRAEKQDFRLRTFINGLVQSRRFRMK